MKSDLLSNIYNPSDLRLLKEEQLTQVAQELRQCCPAPQTVVNRPRRGRDLPSSRRPAARDRAGRSSPRRGIRPACGGARPRR